MPRGVLAGPYDVGAADGTFETDLSGTLVEGDVRLVARVGALLPTEGVQAVLLTTAPDSGAAPSDADTGVLRIENVTVPAGAATLRMDYDLLTDEPAPSLTNDRFTVTLIGAGGAEELLRVDTFDPLFPAPWTGYAHQTGLRAMVADVSAHAGTGEVFTLEIRVKDVGDGRGNTAVMVDNLHFAGPGEPLAAGGPEYVAVARDETIRFDGTGSSDPDGTLVEYRWDFRNGVYGVGPVVDYAFPEDGIYQVALTVTDDAGQTHTDHRWVVVGELNHAPSIVSAPNVSASEGVPYRYQVVAEDRESVYGDVLTFSLTQAPAGMSIDPVSGLITWTPPVGGPAKNPVTVRVEDSAGLSDTQSFQVAIGPEVYVAVTLDDGRVYTARSNGDGTFGAPVIAGDMGRYTRGAVIADFDHDGDFDLISGQGDDSPRVHLYYFEKQGTRLLPPVYLGAVGDFSHPAGSWLMDMAAGDFNNDGEMDFVVNGDSANTWLFLNRGTLEFREEVLFASDFESGLDGWGGAQSGTSFERDDTTSAGGDWSLRVYATGNSSLSVDINPAGWDLKAGPTMSFAYRIPPGVPVGLFIRVQGKGWLALGGSPAFDPGRHTSIGAVDLIDDDQWHTATVDLHGAVLGHWPDAGPITEFEWYTDRNASAGQQFWFDDFRVTRRGYVSGFDVRLAPSTGGQGRGMDAADVNRDGNLDFARARYRDGKIHLYQGDGSGGFTTSFVGDPGGNPYGLVLADFDEDGKVDMIANAGSNGDPYFFRGNGNGTFQSPVYVPSLDTGDYSAYSAYDFDNDGHRDILVTRFYGRRALVYPGNGDASFGPPVEIGTFPDRALGCAAPAGREWGQPLAVAAADRLEIPEGGAITFDGTGSSDDGAVVAYTWDFGDGTQESGPAATHAVVTHTFGREGRYRVLLTVTDDEGKQDRRRLDVTVRGAPPTADPGGPYVVSEDHAVGGQWWVRFDGSGSSDPETGIARYEWDFGDGWTEDFDGGAADAWTVSSGTWAPEGGGFRQTDTSLSRAIAVAGSAFIRDSRLEADVQILGGNGQEAMLLLRSRGEDRYEFILRGRGLNDVLIGRRIGNSWKLLARRALPEPLVLERTYRLGAEAVGSRLRLYLDGKQLLEVTDTALAFGRPGLATYRSDVRFDNVVLRCIGEGPSPLHLFPGGGPYTVTLTVYDGIGQADSATTTVTLVPGAPPVASVTGPAELDESAASLGEWTGRYDLSASSDDTGIERFELDWGDGSTSVVAALRDDFGDGDYFRNPSWTTNGGSWTVTDGRLHQTATDTGNKWVWIQDLSRTYGDFELEVDFRGESSSDGYMGIVFRNANRSASTDSYLLYSRDSWDKWRFYDWRTDRVLAEGGSGWDPGVWYHLRLVVKDGFMRLYVTPEGGTEALELEAPAARHPTGGIGLLAHSQSLTYDNVKVTPLDAWHRYETPGDYTVTVTAYDHAGQSASSAITTAVTAGAAPTADAGGPYVLTEADAWDGRWELVLDLSGSSDDHAVQRYEVDFGDGTACTLGAGDGARTGFFAAGTSLYLYDVPAASLRILASEADTRVELLDLATGDVLAASTLGRYELWTYGPPDGTYLKIRASKPVVVYETDFGGHSAFVPSLGGAPVGHEFVFYRVGGQGFYVFAYDDALVRFYTRGGALAAEQELTAGTYWQPPVNDGIYRVVSTGRVAMQTVGNNGYTTVPSATGEAAGREFYFAVRKGTTGAVAVLAHEDADLVVTDMDTGETLFTPHVASGDLWWQTGLGTRRLKITSTGDVEVWAGDTEGGSGVESLGDDVSVTTGRRGTEFVLHSLRDGVVIFAPNDDTRIDVDSGGLVRTLRRDEYLHLAPGDFPGGGGVHRITTSKPVVIQTLGRANVYNDVGTYAGGATARHRYTAPGTYDLTVVAVDRAGQRSDPATTTVEVRIGAPPVAVIDAPAVADEDAAEGGKWTVSFDASGSSDDSEIIRYEWDFGDGGTSRDVSPTHVYDATGRYPVTLTVTDRGGQRTTTTWDLEVKASDPPVADAGGPYVLTEADAHLGVWYVTLDATGSTDDYAVYDYLWEFDPIVSDDFSSDTLDTGRWMASGVTVADGSATLQGTGNWSNRYLFSVEDAGFAEGLAFVARIRPSSGCRGMWGFKNTSATNFHYNQMPYALYFDNGRLVIYENGKSMGRVGTYEAGQWYEMRIRLERNGAVYEIREAGTGPWTTLYRSYVPPPDLLKGGGTVNTGTFAVDGITIEVLEQGPVVDVSFTEPGTYGVSLTVRDNALQAHTQRTTVEVGAGGAPVADPGGPYTAEVGSPVTLNGAASSDDTGIEHYEWVFGDSTGGPADLPYKGTGAVVRHVYRKPGTYTLQLTVTDAAGQTDTASTTVDVIQGSAPLAAARLVSDPAAGGPPAYLDAGASVDDYGIVEYRWDLDAGVDRDGDGDPANDVDAVGEKIFHVYPHPTEALREGFDGTTVDGGLWITSDGGVEQDGELRITGTGSWGARYFFTRVSLPRSRGFTATTVITPPATGRQRAMWGLKAVSRSGYSYGALSHAIYFDNGTLRIYQNGGQVTGAGTYTQGKAYEVRIDVKPLGADYFIREAGTADWTLLYSDTGRNESPLMVGATVYQGTFVFDDVGITGRDPYEVVLTVEDGAGQTAVTRLRVPVAWSGPPDVITVPWVAHDPIAPHETYNGRQIRLKGIVRDNDPLEFEWDFGDGTSSGRLPVADPYDLSVAHTYPNVPEGTPFIATLTVWDRSGQVGRATYNVIVKAKNLTTEINAAIDEGLWYLHQTQARTTTEGYPSGYWREEGYRASPVASALQAFTINSHLETSDPQVDPYAETVKRGFTYLFSLLGSRDIDTQPYGEPDTNGNGIGIEVVSGRPIYEGGPVMDAIATSATPLARALTGPEGVRRRSYFDILTDMVDMFSWGQGDSDGGGGWRYRWNTWPDNSASQWGAIGMTAAEAIFGIPVPPWVKARNDGWLDTSYDGVGFGYTGKGRGVAQTPSGMVQLAFAGKTRSDRRWITAESHIERNWTSWFLTNEGSGQDNYYAYYAFTKAMRLARPEPVVKMLGGLDWFSDPDVGLARTVMGHQKPDGRFAGKFRWINRDYAHMGTAWGVIILSRTLFVQPPVADAGRDRVWAVGWPLVFDASGSYHRDPFRTIVKYEWDFDGDGVYDVATTSPTATYTYPASEYPETSLPQTITVRLRVTDNNVPPLTDTDTVNIVLAVPPHPPVADADGPYTCTAGIPCGLDGTGSFDIDPTDFIARYEWELDSVFPYDFDEALGPTPTYVWDTPGTYNIVLRVWDNGVLNDLDGDGQLDEDERLSDQDFTTVEVVENLPPVADPDGPYFVDEGSAVVLDGTASSDPNGNPLTFGWDFDGDGRYDDASGPTPTYTGVDDGDYPVGLRVTDGVLEGTGVTTVTVRNVPPAVDAGPDQTVDEGGTVAFAGSFTDPGTADTHTIGWDFGDGGTASGTLTPTHVYAEDGTYSATLTVTDDDGGTGQDTAQVTVVNVAPNVDAGPDQEIVEGDTASLAPAAFTDAGVLDTHTARIDWGDGTAEAGTVSETGGAGTVGGSHVYPQDGTYTVRVEVTDDDGATGADTFTLTVRNAPPVVTVGPDRDVLVGATVELAPAVFTDAGVLDTHTAWIDWGDGTAEAGTVSETGGAGTVEGSHVFTSAGTYTVTVTVSDGTDAGAGSFRVRVGETPNMPPAVNAGPDASVPEGSVFVSSGSFTDPDADDTWTATVDYGDGTGVQVLALAPDKTFGLSHVYADDGVYTVTVSVTDSSGGSGADTAQVTVRNVPPSVAPLSDVTIDEGAVFAQAGSFTDPGADTWTATVDYGDGTGVQALALAPDKTFDLSHVYTTQGVYTLTVTVTDDDGGQGAATATVTVAAPSGQKEPISDLSARAKLDKVSLVWTCVPQATAYNVYRSTVSGGPYELVAEGHVTDYCTYLDPGLVTGRTYYYVVTWTDAGGAESPQSNEAGATPSQRRRRR